MGETVKHHPADILDKEAVHLTRVYNYRDKTRGSVYHAWVLFDAKSIMVGHKHDSRLYMLDKWEKTHGLEGRTLVEIILPDFKAIADVRAKLV